MKKAKLLWVDLEMTGLDPEKDRILEIAAVATGWDLEPLGVPSSAIAASKAAAAQSQDIKSSSFCCSPSPRTSSTIITPRYNTCDRAEFTAVVKVPEKLMKERMVGDFWEKNAESRDALMEQNVTGKSAKEVEDELLEFIDKWFGKEVILAGNSIHQDRKFIDREWPEVAKRLHYRMLDVSTWKVYFEGARNERFVKPELHRALDDIQGSIEELKFYIGKLK